MPVPEVQSFNDVRSMTPRQAAQKLVSLAKGKPKNFSIAERQRRRDRAHKLNEAKRKAVAK